VICTVLDAFDRSQAVEEVKRHLASLPKGLFDLPRGTAD
jgi:hypothetical protein